MKLEIAFPAYAEAKVLPLFLTELRNTIVLLPEEISVTCTLFDDGSTDTTPEIFSQWCGQLPEKISGRYIRAANRMGYASAVAKLITYARADSQALVLLDSDLQDPPILIAKLLKSWQAHPESAVIARRISRRGKFFENLSSSLFHSFMRLARVYSADSGIFGIYPQSLLEKLQKDKRQKIFLPELIYKLNFPQYFIDYSREPRAVGDSKAGWVGRIYLAFTAFEQILEQPIMKRVWEKRYWIFIPAILIAIFFGLLVLVTKKSLLDPAAYIRY